MRSYPSSRTAIRPASQENAQYQESIGNIVKATSILCLDAQYVLLNCLLRTVCADR